MNTELETIATPEASSQTLNRRTLLSRVALAGAGLAALRVLPSNAQAAMMPKQPEADTGHNYPMMMPNAKTEKQFRMGVIGPAMLSLVTSQIAVDKATSPAAMEFANFELREAIGVLEVLKSLKTPAPPMNATAKATLAKIKNTPKGAEFDKVYMTAQLANHEFLRDLANSYLANSKGHTSMAEMHGRHLATLTLGVFKEHVVHCKHFLSGMML